MNKGMGAVYGLGLLGALVYYIQHASTFTATIWGIVLSLVWPAYLVYKALELIG